MAEHVARIRVGPHVVGIFGLEETLASLAESHAQKSDEDVGDALLERLRTQNYIPEQATDRYKEAFVREFRKFLGQPVGKSSLQAIEIEVLGQGCPRCDRLEQDVMELLSELGLSGSVDHIRDPIEIARYGIVPTPALVVNGKIVSAGTVPTRSKLRKWLLDASESIGGDLRGNPF